MDFTYDDEQKALQSAVREMANRLVPQETSGDVPVGPRPLDRDAWTALAEMGLLGLPISEDAGGMGASPVEVSIAAAELGAARLELPYADAMAAAVVVARGEGGDDLLESIVDGSSVVLTALAEPGRAWDPEHPEATATKSDDGWTITGHKLGNNDLTEADAVVTTAQCPDEGCTCVFLVRQPKASGASVSFESAEAIRLGDLDLLAEGLNVGIIALGGEALGAMGAALRSTVEYLKTRKQFGVPLAAFQTLTQRAADMYVSVELARSTVNFASMAITDHPGDSATASRLKLITGRTGRHVGQEAIQLHGGIGMTAEYSVGHHTTRLTQIEHTFGDSRYHLARLTAGVREHEMVDVLA